MRGDWVQVWVCWRSRRHARQSRVSVGPLPCFSSVVFAPIKTLHSLSLSLSLSLLLSLMATALAQAPPSAAAGRRSPAARPVVSLKSRIQAAR